MPLDRDRIDEVFDSNLTRLSFFIFNLINYLYSWCGFVKICGDTNSNNKNVTPLSSDHI